MPKLGERKCPCCGDLGLPDGGYDAARGYYADEWRWAERTQRMICAGCYDSDVEHASTVIRFTCDGKSSVRVGDEVLEDPPFWFGQVFESRGYVHTDGWRGYYDTKLKGEYVKLGTGWVTAWPDDSVGYKQAACDLAEALCERRGWRYLPEGVTLYWVFDPTSNVFSTASDLLVPADQAEKVRWWLATQFGFSPRAIAEAFE